MTYGEGMTTMQIRSGSGTICRSVAAAALLAVAASVVLPLAPAGAQSPRPVGGVWEMDGYGTVLSLDDGLLQEYQVTGVSCIKGLSAERAGGSPGAARYANDDGDVFTVRPKARPDRASVHIDGSPGDRGLRRIDALPADCLQQTPGDPVAAFDTLWQTFHENYPLFDAKGMTGTPYATAIVPGSTPAPPTPNSSQSSGRWWPRCTTRMSPCWPVRPGRTG